MELKSRKEELIEYLKLKNEAREFWTRLKDAVKGIEEHIDLLERQIATAKIELDQINERANL